MPESIRIPMEVCAKILNAYYSILDTRRDLNNIRYDMWEGKFFDAHEKARERQEKIEELTIKSMKEFLKYLRDNGYWFKDGD